VLSICIYLLPQKLNVLNVTD